MRFRIRVVSAGVLALGVSACATIMVSSHVDPEIDLRAFRTYDWGPRDALPIADPRLDADPHFHDYVQGAAEKQLVINGLERASPARPADVLIHYHATVATRIDVNQADRAHGYAVGDSAEVVEYEAGTLVFDVVDARTRRVIWRGWARDRFDGVFDDPDRLHEKIDAAVRGIFEQFHHNVAGGR